MMTMLRFWGVVDSGLGSWLVGWTGASTKSAFSFVGFEAGFGVCLNRYDACALKLRYAILLRDDTWRTIASCYLFPLRNNLDKLSQDTDLDAHLKAQASKNLDLEA